MESEEDIAIPNASKGAVATGTKVGVVAEEVAVSTSSDEVRVTGAVHESDEDRATEGVHESDGVRVGAVHESGAPAVKGLALKNGDAGVVGETGPN